MARINKKNYKHTPLNFEFSYTYLTPNEKIIFLLLYFIHLNLFYFILFFVE